MRIFEVVNGDKSDFFGDEETARLFRQAIHEKELDAVPFIDKHFAETPQEVAELLNKVTARRSGQATGAIRSANPCASEDSTTRNPEADWPAPEKKSRDPWHDV